MTTSYTVCITFAPTSFSYTSILTTLS